MRSCFLVVVVILVQQGLAQIQRKDPTVCDKAVMRRGIGFNPHPYDCSQFIQCYYRGRRVIPVYRSCDFGQFWNQTTFRCLPSEMVKCKHDKCTKAGVTKYKHSDPNKCGAYWDCQGGVTKGMCCPEGEAFHPVKGCIPSPSCVDMCPLQDRVPGCTRRPVSGAPTKFEQYTDNGEWKRENCPPRAAYNPADCDCTLTDLIVAGRKCKPEFSIDFNDGFRDKTGNNVYQIIPQRIRIHRGGAYFNGMSKLVLKQVKPHVNDEGVLIVKIKYTENLRNANANKLQAILTNGHCGREPSVVIGKLPGMVLVGAETNMSRSFPLPTVMKLSKEIIYIHDQYKLEGRVCGAVGNDWSIGSLKDPGCGGFQFGADSQMAGYVGLMDDIDIYRCKPLETVININY